MNGIDNYNVNDEDRARFNNQEEKILAHLQEYGSIGVSQAEKLYRSKRLAAVIERLRLAGYVINGERDNDNLGLYFYICHDPQRAKKRVKYQKVKENVLKSIKEIGMKHTLPYEDWIREVYSPKDMRELINRLKIFCTEFWLRDDQKLAVQHILVILENLKLLWGKEKRRPL